MVDKIGILGFIGDFFLVGDFLYVFYDCIILKIIKKQKKQIQTNK